VKILDRGIYKLDESRLQSLLESAKLLNSSLALDDLLAHLLRTVMGRLLVSKAVVAVDLDGSMRVALARGLPRAICSRKRLGGPRGWNDSFRSRVRIKLSGLLPSAGRRAGF